MRKRNTIVLLSIVMVLALASQACNLFSRQSTPSDIVVEEVLVVEEPVEEAEIEEKTWSSELVYQLLYEEKIASLAYSSDGTMIAIGFFMQADLLTAEDGSKIKSLELTHSADDLQFTPDDSQLAAAISVGGVRLIDVTSGEEVHKLHDGFDSRLAISPDGSLIATGNREGVAWVWDIQSGESLAELDPSNQVDNYSEYLTAITFSPDGQKLAVGHWDGNVFIWDVTTGALLDHLEPASEFCGAWDLAFSPGGEYLAVGGANVDFRQTVRIWDIANGTILYDLAEVDRTGAMHAPVVFSQDGNLLAAGGMGGIYLWELTKFEFIHHIPIEDTGATDWVTDLAFSPDSQRLAAGFWDGYAQLWQLEPPTSSD